MLELSGAKLYVNGQPVEGVLVGELTIHQEDKYVEGRGVLPQMRRVEITMTAPQELIDFLQQYRVKQQEQSDEAG